MTQKRNDGGGIGNRATFYSKGSAYMNYFLMSAFGGLRDFVGERTGMSRFSGTLNSSVLKDMNGKDIKFKAVIPTWKGFYIRRVYGRVQECFERAICGPPGAHILPLPRHSNENGDGMVVEEGYLLREKQVKAIKDGTIKPVLNLGSYNYLGFADNWTETCGPDVLPILSEMGIVASSSALEAGYTDVHKELERTVAEYLHQESALIFSMGYGTNATVLANILTPGTVVVSDGLNHTSIVNGCRGAHDIKIVPFKHNSMEDLELVLKRLLLCGKSYPKLPQNDQFNQWSKIVVIVEGIYSMEGELCHLKQINKLCKEYKAYLYVDEAHSIGALGQTGRGICEHEGVDFNDVDLLMGTFSKSFGGMGGYVAGKKQIIDKLRASCAGQTSMSPLSTLITKQVLTVFRLIMEPGGIGQEKIRKLRENSNYFRNKLRQIGVTVLGDEDSPVIPLMLYSPSKLLAFSQEMLLKDIAVVTVAYPATPMEESRARFCVSAAHTREDLRAAVHEIHKVSRLLNVRFEKSVLG